MCDLRNVCSETKVEGYKVVVRKLKGRRYFSAAMGFRYPLDGHVPIVRRQRRISSGFKDDIILELSNALRKDMIGRTAMFPSFDDARGEYCYLRKRDIEKGYKVVVVRVILSVDMMEGVYCGCRVIAGRHIRFIYEVDSEEEEWKRGKSRDAHG